MHNWPTKKLSLEAPSLSELASLLDSGLKAYFNHAASSVATCPDLQQAPFHLAASGISGNERIADIGGPLNLHPTPKLDRKYSLLDTMKEMGMNNERGFVLGAGAGPFHVVGMNSELMPNLSYEGSKIKNLTHLAKIGIKDECICEPIPSNSTDFALMANLFGSDGIRGEVIKVVARGRIGKLNFVAAIQEILKTNYGQRPVSIGGVFVIRKGKALLHVMPDFSLDPLEVNQMKDWLRFFEMSAPLVCLTVFHSYDPGLDLRMEHTHCFSDHGEGGHYHNDTTLDDVEYEAYLNTAKVLYRIDQPE